MTIEMKDVQAVPFWGFWNEGPIKDMPNGMIGAAAVGCANPKCETGCPSVAITFVVEGQRLELRLDPEPARALGASIIEHAGAQSTQKVN